MLRDHESIGREYSVFDSYTRSMKGISPATKVFLQGWRYIQDTRTEDDRRGENLWRVAWWELEKETGIKPNTMRKIVSELVKLKLIEKCTKEMKHAPDKGELWLSKIYISTLQNADASGILPEPKIPELPICPRCGSRHIVDITTRVCQNEICGYAYEKYRTDYSAIIKQETLFYNDCLADQLNGYIKTGMMINLHKLWEMEDGEERKPIRPDTLKRVLYYELGVGYKHSGVFNGYTNIRLTPHAQQLLQQLENNPTLLKKQSLSRKKKVF